MERLTVLGKVAPKAAKDIAYSRLGIGFEKLDRKVFDPNKAYDSLKQIGIKWVRIQSGWQRTEKEKGIYDFSWLDEIVDRLIADGMWPWINVVYGNELYDERAAAVFGAVGCPPIFSEEAHTAWLNYVRALTKHYAGRVKYFEIWNEPNTKYAWKPLANATEFGRFTNETAVAAKEGNPDCRVIGGVLARVDPVYTDEAAEAGMFEHLDAFSYHLYSPVDCRAAQSARIAKATVRMYKPGIEVFQGEGGTQSRSGGNGALKKGVWSERRQCRYMLRHLVTDLGEGVDMTSYFSCMDMIEALHGLTADKSSYQDYGYFGVLSAEFDEDGFAIGEYGRKPSYYTLQTLASIFEGKWTAENFPIRFYAEESPRLFAFDVEDYNVQTYGFERPDGTRAFAYWYATDIMTTEYEGTISLQIGGVPGEIHLIDLIDGTEYALPDSICERLGNGRVNLHNLPIKDYPMLLTFGNFIR